MPPTPPVLRTPTVVRPAGGLLTKYGNTALTAVLLVVAAVLAVRWYARTTDNARVALVQQLETARGDVQQLRSQRLMVGPMGQLLSPGEVIVHARALHASGGGLLADVINKTDDPAIKARALALRGDLNWAAANVPPSPGAATQPSQVMVPPPDELLKQAADAYTAAAELPGAAPLTVASAKLGLAAVAENRSDWASARQQLQAVADMKDATVAVLASAASTELAELPLIEHPIYLAPIPDVPATQPTTAPTTLGRPTTSPATRRAAVPAAVISPAATRPSK